VFAGLTLGAYIGTPYLLLWALALAYWSPACRALMAFVAITYWLPLRPLAVPGILHSYVFLAWRRYFKFSVVFDDRLDAYKDYVIAQFPHGAFPLGARGAACVFGRA
jgi:diacylglycerol O-acyltransferase 2, plant